ncbi:MAG: uncharacterized protein QOF10_6224 [Kribbellaceae bacterium]|nr:uncharacterized protein [Kribbellaceae bacterium]
MEEPLSSQPPFGPPSQAPQQPYGGPPPAGPPQYAPGAPQYGPGAPQYGPEAPQYGPGAPQYGPGPQQYAQAPQYGPGPQQSAPGPQYAASYGPPPGGPGFGWGPGGPPRRKKSKAVWIVVPVVLGFACIVGLWIAGVVAKQNRLNDYSSPEPTYSSSYDPTNPPTEAPTNGTTTSAPTSKPTATKTTPPPARRATPYEVVSRNKFYRTGTQNSVGCKESGARATTLANAVKYYSVVKGCADRGWPRQVRGGGWQFRAPKTIVMNGRVQSPCGGYAPSSYYCSANETIYMAGADDVAEYKRYRNSASGLAFNRAGMAFTVAHEYGHHVQELTGVLEAYGELRYDASSQSAKLEVNRRMELQASCLAGVFLAANKGTYPIGGQLKTQLDFVTNNSGDEYDPSGQRIHGNKKNHGYWFHRGYNTRNLAACNTFTAPSSQVA